jgi:hypothetical protein
MSLDKINALEQPYDEGREEIPPRWEPEHVGRRLVKAFVTLDRLPRLRGPREPGGHWPQHAVEWADRLAQAELSDAERAHARGGAEFYDSPPDLDRDCRDGGGLRLAARLARRRFRQWRSSPASGRFMRRGADRCENSARKNIGRLTHSIASAPRRSPISPIASTRATRRCSETRNLLDKIILGCDFWSLSRLRDPACIVAR